MYKEAPREALAADGRALAGEAAAAAALARAESAPAGPPPPPLTPTPQYSTRAAQGVHAAASSAATGVAAGAVARASPRWRQGEPTAQPLRASPGLQRRMDRTARAAKLASRATHKVGKGLGWAGAKVLGAALWALGFSRPLREGGRPGAAREAAQAAAAGVVAVWESLEAAGYLVLTSARDAAAAVARHRLGPEAGEVARSGLTAAAYAGDAVVNVSGRAAAREGAKRTARGVLRQVAGPPPRGATT
jgi:uncharacterized Zn-binding protein involved in type VI secretion